MRHTRPYLGMMSKANTALYSSFLMNLRQATRNLRQALGKPNMFPIPSVEVPCLSQQDLHKELGSCYPAGARRTMPALRTPHGIRHNGTFLLLTSVLCTFHSQSDCSSSLFLK